MGDGDRVRRAPFLLYRAKDLPRGDAERLRDHSVIKPVLTMSY